MPNTYVAFADAPLGDAEETAPKCANGNHKKHVVMAFLGSFAFAMILKTGINSQFVAQNPVTFMASPFQSKVSIASLPGSSAFKNTFIQVMEANNGKCLARDVSMKAQAAPKDWIAAWEDRTGTALAPEGVYTKLMANDKWKPLSKAKVQDMAGVSGPLGVFDPFGISTKVPEGQLMFYREAELKHGRVCMMAIIGLIVGERHDFIPLLSSGIDPNAPAYVIGTPLIQETTIGQFWPVAIGALFAEEARREYFRKKDPNAAPGDYGWDPLGFKPTTAEGFKEMQTKELNNGRLAMFASAGIIAQEMITGEKVLPGIFGR